MTPAYLSQKFDSGLTYFRYVVTGSDEQQRRWQQVYDAALLKPPQQALVQGFVRPMKLLVISGIWCGDCVEQVPLLARIAEANPARLDLRILDRDQNPDLADPFRLNGGSRVPIVLFLAEDFEFCGMAGDRTLSRYRALARRQLGPACPLGLAPPDPDELGATLQDWLNEVERIQLMLRLSNRLRQKHGD